VVVLSNNDGCVVAIRELIRRHRVRVFSSNYALYGQGNRAMWGVDRRRSARITGQDFSAGEN
jgi:hypothetical protein